MLSTNKTDGSWKEAPGERGLMSQFHRNNGARALGIVAIVHSHSVHQLTRKLHHILSKNY